MTLVRLHLVTGCLALLIIVSFFLSTVTSELMGDLATIHAVKTAILWGMLLLVPAIIATGISGMQLGRGSENVLVLRKKRRMPFIAVNGVVFLVPSALMLQALSSTDSLDTSFYMIQAVELLAGATNIVLMSLNIRDGLRLTRRFGKR